MASNGSSKRLIRVSPRIITKAQGVKITDIDGHQTVDAVGGLWCVNLGYSNQRIKEAITKQLSDLPYYSLLRALPILWQLKHLTWCEIYFLKTA